MIRVPDFSNLRNDFFGGLTASIVALPLTLAFGVASGAGLEPMLGAIDSLLTPLVADSMTRDFHDSDRELAGQGIGKLVAGLLGGIPGAGATISGLMSFGAAFKLVRRMSLIGDYEILIINLLDVPEVDGSAALALEEIMQAAKRAGREVVIVGLSLTVARLFAQMGILDQVHETHRVANRYDVITIAVSSVESRNSVADA